MVELAIALGIGLNLLLTEIVGFTAAGLVVPGYLALHLNQPARLSATLGVAIATWAMVRWGLARLFVLYGRRRFSVAVLTGFFLNLLLTLWLRDTRDVPWDLRIIGHIVPGIIANEALAQGVVPTLAATFLVAAVVRLLLLLV